MRKRFISLLDRVEATGGNLTIEDWNELYKLREVVKIMDGNTVQRVKGEKLCLVISARREIERVLGNAFADIGTSQGTHKKPSLTPLG